VKAFSQMAELVRRNRGIAVWDRIALFFERLRITMQLIVNVKQHSNFSTIENKHFN
jgi:hypothetical protein